MEHFTDRAKIVVMKAQNEARIRNSSEVTSVHLLLGLAAEWEALAGRTLQEAGVSREALAQAAAAALPDVGNRFGYHVDFSEGMKRVRDLVVQESLRLGHNYVGTEHLLLGLLEAQDEPGARILAELGVTKADAEARIMAALAELKRRSSA